MATMKPLQNNFTTPEQSKQLLELGVPADSADCCFYLNTNYSDKPHILYKKLSEKQADYDSPLSSIKAILYPCWSAGRLIEIYETCFIDKLEPHVWYNYRGKGDTIVERLLWDFEDKTKNKLFDFSKLED